jgi:hypothetical protein
MVVLVSLCGSPVPLGGSATPTASPIPIPGAHSPVSTQLIPTPTPPLVAPYLAPCTVDQLSIAFVSPNAADGEAFSSFGINNTSPSSCRLTGPPVLHFRSNDGSEIAIPYATPVCGGGSGLGCLAFTTDLSSNAPTPRQFATPPAVPGYPVQIRLTVTGTFADRLSTCEVPTPATLGLAFPGMDGELDVPLTGGYAPVTCWVDVTLHDYGPPSG